MKNIIKLSFLFALITGFTACSSDDDTPEQINEEELITRVVLEITETGTTNTNVYTWNEGSGVSEPIVLDQGVSYEVEVGFFNASNPNSPEDITTEVIEEADEHQIFYESSTSSIAITPAADDYEDSMGNKLGVLTNWTGSSSTSGNVVVYLIHEPTSKTGTDRDDLGGETDVQVSFTVAVN